MDFSTINIGFDAKRIVGNATGLGNYGRNLINAMVQLPDCPHLMLYAPNKGRDALRCQIDRHENVEFRYSGRSNRILQDLWRSAGIVGDLKRDNIALYHGLSGELPKGIKAGGIKTIVTIHDLIFMRHPEFYKWIDVQLYKCKFYCTLREADRIVAISECTKRDILHYSDYPEDQIDVVYQSCGTTFDTAVSDDKIRFVREKYALPQHFVLNVGTIEARKNILLAVKALQQLDNDISLVIVGRNTDYADRVLKYAQDNNIGHRIILLHNIPNDDLPAIYQAAQVFVYPSRYEGFGIPIIEAIQSGLPVVAATGSCLEEAGGPDSIYVHPDDDKGMAEAIRTLLDDNVVRQASVRKSREYVRRFESVDMAKGMMEEYRKTGILR